MHIRTHTHTHTLPELSRTLVSKSWSSLKCESCWNKMKTNVWVMDVASPPSSVPHPFSHTLHETEFQFCLLASAYSSCGRRCRGLLRNLCCQWLRKGSISEVLAYIQYLIVFHSVALFSKNCMLNPSENLFPLWVKDHVFHLENVSGDG